MTLARAFLQADSFKPIIQHRLVGGIFCSDSISIDCIVFDASILGGRVLQDLLLLLLAGLKPLKSVFGQLLSTPGVRGVVR